MLATRKFLKNHLFSSWSGYFRQQKMVEEKTKFRVLIIDPESEAVESMRKYYRLSSAADVKGDLERTLSSIQMSIDKGVEPGEMQVKLLQTHPHFSMILVNPNDDTGKIFVEFIDFSVPIHSLPHLELNQNTDGESIPSPPSNTSKNAY